MIFTFGVLITKFVLLIFLERFDRMKNSNDHYFIVVVEDKTLNKIVGAATLFLELKFIHQLNKVC